MSDTNALPLQHELPLGPSTAHSKPAADEAAGGARLPIFHPELAAGGARLPIFHTELAAGGARLPIFHPELAAGGGRLPLLGLKLLAAGGGRLPLLGLKLLAAGGAPLPLLGLKLLAAGGARLLASSSSVCMANPRPSWLKTADAGVLLLLLLRLRIMLHGLGGFSSLAAGCGGGLTLG
jgi:hypothetical protein